MNMSIDNVADADTCKQGPHECPVCHQVFNESNECATSLLDRLCRHIRDRHSPKDYVQFRQSYRRGVLEEKCDKCGFYKKYRRPCLPTNCKRNIQRIKAVEERSDKMDHKNESSLIVDIPKTTAAGTDVVVNSDQMALPTVNGSSEKIDCPVCHKVFDNDDFKTNRIDHLYQHIRQRHTVKDYVTFRRSFLPGIHEQKCDMCGFYKRHGRPCQPQHCARNIHRSKMANEIEQGVDVGRSAALEQAKLLSDEDMGKVDDIIVADKFECPECDKKLKKSKLFRHIRQQHGEAAYLKLRTCVIECVQEYRCGACYFVFSNRSKPNHQCEHYSQLTRSINLDAIQYVGEVVNDKII